MAYFKQANDLVLNRHCEFWSSYPHTRVVICTRLWNRQPRLVRLGPRLCLTKWIYWFWKQWRQSWESPMKLIPSRWEVANFTLAGKAARFPFVIQILVYSIKLLLWVHMVYQVKELCWDPS
jgi:hypothetical protein